MARPDDHAHLTGFGSYEGNDEKAPQRGRLGPGARRISGRSMVKLFNK